MTALENRMAMGNYYEEDEREYILDTSPAVKYAEFVYDRSLEGQVFGKWLGVILNYEAALDLWEHIEEEFVDRLCQQWVTDNMVDEFVEWRKCNERIH